MTEVANGAVAAKVGKCIKMFLSYIEDNRVRAASSTVVDAQVGYASRLPGEPADGVNDLHFHPGEMRSFCISLSYRF